MPSLTFPIDKSFYQKDNLFKHDFLLRRSFDNVDLLWYRTHEDVERVSDRAVRNVDDYDLQKINDIIDSCPDNELEFTLQDSLNNLEALQLETEIFDFYYEFYYINSDEVIKEEMILQRRNDIIRDLASIETDELTSDYIKFWDCIYEKSALKTMISPDVWDNENSTSYSKAVKKNKVPSDYSDFSEAKTKDDLRTLKHDSSVMNARFFLQQLKEKGLEDDRLTYVNVFADEDEDENDEAEFSSSGTLSTEVEAPAETSGSILTEISFEVDSTAVETDSGMKDPFKDKSYDCLYYVVRLIYDSLVLSSGKYFDEAPIILLENDLVIEMKGQEMNYLTNYNKKMNKSLVKVVDNDGVEGYKSRMYCNGLKTMINDLTIHIEKVKHEGVVTVRNTKKFSEASFSIERAPKVGTSDYRKITNFDIKSEEVRSIGQKRKIKQFKTAVCLAGRTKLRRYDYSEKITGELNNIRFPIQKLGHLTKTVQEHVATTADSYLATLLNLTRRRKFFEDYPDDMYDKIHDSVSRMKALLNDYEQLNGRYERIKNLLAEKAVYKPLGPVRLRGEATAKIDLRTTPTIRKSTAADDNDIEYDRSKVACFTPGLNVIMAKKKNTFEKSTIALSQESIATTSKQLDLFEYHGRPEYQNE